MKIYKSHRLSFSVNNWSHLYSLQKAISHLKQLTGRNLSIHGRLLNHEFLNHTDTSITIEFLQSETMPDFPRLNSGEHILGSMTLLDQQLSTQICVERSIFEELRKNLMEYADIEAIHIIVTLEILSENDSWRNGEQLNIIQLDYAMKGD